MATKSTVVSECTCHNTMYMFVYRYIYIKSMIIIIIIQFIKFLGTTWHYAQG